MKLRLPRVLRESGRALPLQPHQPRDGCATAPQRSHCGLRHRLRRQCCSFANEREFALPSKVAHRRQQLPRQQQETKASKRALQACCHLLP
jgi:hypothetical protein